MFSEPLATITEPEKAILVVNRVCVLILRAESLIEKK